MSWKSKKQTVVARLSAEAEYRAVAQTICEVTWILGLLKEMYVQHKDPVLMFCDNQAALHIA